MTYLKITALASLEVSDCKNLAAAWKLYGGPGSLVGSLTVRKPLTPGLRARLG